MATFTAPPHRYYQIPEFRPGNPYVMSANTGFVRRIVPRAVARTMPDGEYGVTIPHWTPIPKRGEHS